MSCCYFREANIRQLTSLDLSGNTAGSVIQSGSSLVQKLGQSPSVICRGCNWCYDKHVNTCVLVVMICHLQVFQAAVALPFYVCRYLLKVVQVTNVHTLNNFGNHDTVLDFCSFGLMTEKMLKKVAQIN